MGTERVRSTQRKGGTHSHRHAPMGQGSSVYIVCKCALHPVTTPNLKFKYLPVSARFNTAKWRNAVRVVSVRLIGDEIKVEGEHPLLNRTLKLCG